MLLSHFSFSFKLCYRCVFCCVSAGLRLTGRRKLFELLRDACLNHRWTNLMLAFAENVFVT